MSMTNLIINEVFDGQLIDYLTHPHSYYEFINYKIYNSGKYLISSKRKYYREYPVITKLHKLYHDYFEDNSDSSIFELKELAARLYRENDMNKWQIIAHKLREKRSIRAEHKSNFLSEIDTQYPFNFNNFETLILRDFLCLNSYRELPFTSLSSHCDSLLPSHPIFTYNILNYLHNFGQTNKSLGIEGGVCLFGKFELVIQLKYKEDLLSFDWFSGEILDNNCSFSATSIYEIDFKTLHKFEIYSVSNHKSCPTLQNFIDIYNLLFFSKCLNVPIVIGLPDYEYFSFYCNNFTSSSKFTLLFKRILRTVLMGIIFIINRLSQLFEITPFINCGLNKLAQQHMNIAINSIENSDFKIKPSHQIRYENILRYSAMPILPHLIFNNNYILEINNISEAASLKNCKNVFKDVNFSMIGIPSLPGGNGEFSLTNSPLSDKIYLNNLNKLTTLNLDTENLFKDYLKPILYFSDRNTNNVSQIKITEFISIINKLFIPGL